MNLINNMLLQERFKYLQLLPIFNEKVFSNFREKDEKIWPMHIKMVIGPTRSYTVLHDWSSGLDRTDCGPELHVAQQDRAKD